LPDGFDSKEENFVDDFDVQYPMYERLPLCSVLNNLSSRKDVVRGDGKRKPETVSSSNSKSHQGRGKNLEQIQLLLQDSKRKRNREQISKKSSHSDSEDIETDSSFDEDESTSEQRRFETLQRHYKGRILKEIKCAFAFQGDFHGNRARKALQKIESILNIQNGDWKAWWMLHRQKLKSKEKRIPVRQVLQSNEALKKVMHEYSKYLDTLAMYRFPPTHWKF
jgi:hypothetical protein